METDEDMKANLKRKIDEMETADLEFMTKAADRSLELWRDGMQVTHNGKRATVTEVYPNGCTIKYDPMKVDVKTSDLEVVRPTCLSARGQKVFVTAGEYRGVLGTKMCTYDVDEDYIVMKTPTDDIVIVKYSECAHVA